MREVFSNHEIKNKVEKEFDINNEIKLALETMSPEKAENYVIKKIKDKIDNSLVVKGI